MHAINGVNISEIEGAVIHSKFLSDFIPRVRNYENQR